MLYAKHSFCCAFRTVVLKIISTVSFICMYFFLTERKNKKHAKLYFACQGKGEHCLYSKHFFTMKTRNPRIWIHLMFLALQVNKQNYQ